MKAHLLIVDDDEDFLQSLRLGMETTYAVHTAKSVGEALNLFSKHSMDFALVDYRLQEDQNGHDLIEEMRRRRPMQGHFLLMTAFADKELAIQSVNRRLDGFLEKPFSLTSLAHLLEQLLQSRHLPDEMNVDTARRAVEYRGKVVALTRTELSMLSLFRESPGIFFTRQQIEAKIWPNVQVAKNNLDTHLSRLRAKIPLLKKRLICVRGEGFVYRPHERVDD
ncbi:MAG: response regulator transcription factor [Bdellovibrionaceae bacterium]|nr:response regulator transcription factor [Pseudobdellovibrionaceae bacterium]MBX3033865.1 response regulator transcription factor [Pseudobdellovibrionaceae bacterium]